MEKFVWDLVRALMTMADAYPHDFDLSVWYRQFHVTVRVAQKLNHKIAIHIHVVDVESKSSYIVENDDVGTWTKSLMILRPSSVTSVVERTLEFCNK